MDDYQIEQERIGRVRQWLVRFRGVPIGWRKSYHLALLLAQAHRQAMLH